MCIEQWAVRNLEEKLENWLLSELYCIQLIGDEIRRGPRYNMDLSEDAVRLYLKEVIPIAIRELQQHATGEKPRRPITKAERDKRMQRILEIAKIVKKYVDSICKFLFDDEKHLLNGNIRYIIYEVVVKYNILAYN